MRLEVNHHLDIDVPEWWEVEVSWDKRKLHVFTTQQEADDYARKRVDNLVRVCAESKVREPLVVKWEDDNPFCFKRALLGVELLGVPVWDYSVRIEHCTRGPNGRVNHHVVGGASATA